MGQVNANYNLKVKEQHSLKLADALSLKKT